MGLVGQPTSFLHFRTSVKVISTAQPLLPRPYSFTWVSRNSRLLKAHVIKPLATPEASGQSSMSSASSAGPQGAALDDDLSRAPVAVMSIPACPYCKRAKEALTTAGIPYVDINVDSDQSLRQLVREITGKRTVPQIFLAGRSVGGCDDLLAQLADGSFMQQLAVAKSGSAVAVPPELLKEIQSVRQRAEAKAAQASTKTSAQPLEGLKARLQLPESQGGIARSERTIGSRVFRVFTARQLLDWLSSAGEADPWITATELLAANAVTPATLDRAEAEHVAAAVADAGSGSGTSVPHHAVGERKEMLLLTLATETPRPPAGEALNTQFWWHGPARPANEVAGNLRQLILELYDKHLSPDGRSVSYGAIRSDPQFAEFVVATAELQKVDLSPLSREELMSFAINLYNALIIHALVALNLTRMSAAQRASFFSRTAKYNIGGLDYSADDLENGVLRGNRAGASNLFNILGVHGLAGGHWKSGDPRLGKVVRPVDPRIHFALVCGAKSCPPIKLYTPSNLEEGLAAAAEAFCAGEVLVDRARREVRLSKIFKVGAGGEGRCAA
ncbi:hypothetical protein Vretimale_15254 [Volvox reticuliferus]|uniref:Glutaredoxin domain-containing protein n=1 Tax=Volvox reticuliferus TaxID=1737510 RepID=A0A8J4LW02_9CHLO|nr:hypothetical protein Vretifemale_5449 [Volvox reticuliferus]GIM11790.1 hypothetical protein Vretimale_15254 [Volvox reticuliferus]